MFKLQFRSWLLLGSAILAGGIVAFQYPRMTDVNGALRPGAAAPAPYHYPYYHTAEDTPDKLDYDRLARAVTGIEAIVRKLASD